mmetsp:Transcript_2682/g.2805  ORF Transcript_2682/g.2805 Transcript_2682/m.2805 type:complete len:270 (-) Transcript_2682:200-1009(-)
MVLSAYFFVIQITFILVASSISIDKYLSTRKPVSSNFNRIVSVNSRNEAKCGLNTDEIDTSLTTYMRLPVAQYACVKMPLGATLARVGNSDEFVLEVPTVQFFHLTCQPTVYCTVTAAADDTVTITSEKCILSGSDVVDGLNAHYNFNVITQFSWRDVKIQEKKIISNSKIIVFIDPPLIFKPLPKKVLESAGNLVMQAALNFIEKEFIKSLTDDYVKWATDKNYREKRAAMSSSSIEILKTKMASSSSIKILTKTEEKTKPKRFLGLF